MKATEIKMQIVKNIGNYETVRLEATFTIDDEPLEVAFTTARRHLEESFKASCPNDSMEKEKEILSLDSPTLSRVCQALRSKRQSIENIKEYYILTDSVMSYLSNEKLI